MSAARVARTGGDALHRACATAGAAFTSTATTQVVTGLLNGTTYRFRVQAINAIGTGGYSTGSNPVASSA